MTVSQKRPLLGPASVPGAETLAARAGAAGKSCQRPQIGPKREPTGGGTGVLSPLGAQNKEKRLDRIFAWARPLVAKGPPGQTVEKELRGGYFKRTTSRFGGSSQKLAEIYRKTKEDK